MSLWEICKAELKPKTIISVTRSEAIVGIRGRMAFSELFHTYLNRLEEAQVYFDQGLIEGAVEIIEQVSAEIEASSLSEAEKQHLRTQAESRFGKIAKTPSASGPGEDTGGSTNAGQTQDMPAMEEIDPSQPFEYGMALMDSQFWEEAIVEFKRAAAAGYRVAECLEKCGDCAVLLEKWDEAIRYYETIYTNPNVQEIHKNRILLKITRCSQTQKKIAAKSSPYARSGATQNGMGPPSESNVEPPPIESKVETIASSVASFDHSSIAQLLGQTVQSWRGEKGECLPKEPCRYRILNVLHVGITSQVVELENEATGQRFAGQIPAAPFNRSLDPRSLVRWAHSQRMLDSGYIARVYDVGLAGDTCVIVREYLSRSLLELLSAGHFLPIPLAIFIAYRILEGLGDLHLHMGRDSQIRNVFHLDLRPSRILLHDERPVIKINNGGLWKVLEACNPEGTFIRNLPLPFLAYRAPEQFRPYLARRKPPFFTDIYLFGTLFYEMLTGIPPFRASSFEEYEIQHCDQYPAPPKVWRPEIPTEINDTIMKCLEVDPIKRWRSVTQISLILEKAFAQDIQHARNSIFIKYLNQAKP